MILGWLTLVAAVVLANNGYPEAGNVAGVAFFLAFALIFVVVFVPPLASAGAVAAERSWATSLPFRLDGYFDMLSTPPSYAKTIGFSVRWQNAPCRPPEAALMQSIVAAVDPKAQIQRVDEHSVVFVTGSISGYTGIRVNRSPVYRNHRLPKAVHEMVDRVLVTLHHSHPIAEVKVHA
jgi:hypothetical protein